LLHRRVLDERLGVLCHLLLYKNEAPELVHKPIHVLKGSCQAGTLERIEFEVDEDRHIDLDRPAKPAAGLVDESVLVVVDADRAKCSLREVEDHFAFGWNLSSDEVH